MTDQRVSARDAAVGAAALVIVDSLHRVNSVILNSDRKVAANTLDAALPVLLDGIDRDALAGALDRADDKIQHGIGFGGYDPDGPPLWLADAVKAHLRAVWGEQA